MKRLILLIPVLVGCGATEGSRELTVQNLDAGKMVARSIEAGDLATASQAAADITANSEAVLADIGAPEKPQPYSKEESADARERQKEELATRARWRALLGSAGGGLGSLPVIGPLAGAVIALGTIAWKMRKTILALYQGFDGAMEVVNKKGTPAEVLGAMAKAQEDFGVDRKVKKDIRKLRRSGVLAMNDHSKEIG